MTIRIAKVKKDDDRLGVKAGELYLCSPYKWDEEKVMLLSRIPDGHDPMCNHYLHEVELFTMEVPKGSEP